MRLRPTELPAALTPTDEAETGPPRFIGARDHHEQCIGRPLTLAVDGVELRLVGEPARARKARRGTRTIWRRRGNDQTARRLRPFARRRARTRRPPLVAMRARKPWTRLRCRLLGLKVRFMFGSVVPEKQDQKQRDGLVVKGRGKDTEQAAASQPKDEISTGSGRVYTPRPSRSALPHAPLFEGLPVVEISLWHQCLRRLEAELPEQSFNTWIRPLQAIEDDGRLRLLAPNRYVVDWVNQNCAGRIGELIEELVPAPVPRVSVEIGSRRVALPRPRARHGRHRPARCNRGPARHEPRCVSPLPPPPVLNTYDGHPPRRADPVPQFGGRLNPDFTFGEFRRGQEQPARARRGRAGRRKPRSSLQPVCSSTAASVSARRT